MSPFHWLAHLMGWDSVTDDQYAFASGSGFVLLVWAATVAAWWWRTSCKAEWWCLLHGAHDLVDPETGAVHRLCWVHHPSVERRHLGRARIRELQEKRHIYLGKHPGKG